jgi:hypothetical protein
MIAVHRMEMAAERKKMTSNEKGKAPSEKYRAESRKETTAHIQEMSDIRKRHAGKSSRRTADKW